MLHCSGVCSLSLCVRNRSRMPSYCRGAIIAPRRIRIGLYIRIDPLGTCNGLQASDQDTAPSKSVVLITWAYAREISNYASMNLESLQLPCAHVSHNDGDDDDKDDDDTSVSGELW